jgi:hypothetical protein
MIGASRGLCAGKLASQASKTIEIKTAGPIMDRATAFQPDSDEILVDPVRGTMASIIRSIQSVLSHPGVHQNSHAGGQTTPRCVWSVVLHFDRPYCPIASLSSASRSAANSAATNSDAASNLNKFEGRRRHLHLSKDRPHGAQMRGTQSDL